jgi:transposase
MRRRWHEDEKRAIVAETLLPGTSISAVARQHNLNANQLQKWRREYSSCSPPTPIKEPAFLAVDMAKQTSMVQAAEDEPEQPRKPGRGAGIVEIDFRCGVRLRCDQHVDRQTLSLVVDILMARS